MKIKYKNVNMCEVFFVISARFVPLKKLQSLPAAHYCASFWVKLLIALNMLSCMLPYLRRECTNYKNGLYD